MVSPRIYEFIGIQRENIIDCACDIIESKSKHRLTVKRIADTLRISPLYILKYFDDAADIKDAARARVLSMLIDVHGDFMTGRTGRQALEAYALGERAFAQAHPMLYALAMASPHSKNNEIRRLTKVYNGISVAAVGAYHHNEHRRADISDIAFCISSALQGCLLAEVTGRGGERLDHERNFERMLDILDATCATGG